MPIINDFENIPNKGKLDLKVNKDVVKHLSLGLYRNYALAIKELISNAYDADATEVKIRLDLKNERILIRDNGKGMGYKDLSEKYLSIGYPTEATQKPDKLGRMRVGTFGIGFLAPLPYCEKMILMTKKKGSPKVLTAEINASNFFREGTWELGKEKVAYEICDSDLARNVGETIITLEKIKPQIIKELVKKKQPKTRKNIDKLSGFDKFRWTLCQYAPIQFPPERKELRKIFAVPKLVPMRLWLDGEELFRNVPKGAIVIDSDMKKFGAIEVKYALMTPYVPVIPEESRGLQLRLRDVAIGFPTDFDVTKSARVLGRLNYICGEVHIVKGLDNALMVTRDTFNYTEQVSLIYDFFKTKLTRWDSKLYAWADEDKEIYESLPPEDIESLAEQLKKANVVRFSKERFRLAKPTSVKGKGAGVSLQSDRLKKALVSKGYRVTTSKAPKNKKDTSIKMDKNTNTITIYERHPSFVETITVHEADFVVSYDNWDSSQSAHAICKLKSNNHVVFNRSHPIFRAKVSDKIIKKLSLGTLLLLKDNDCNSQFILPKFNRLLEDVFRE